MSSIGPIELLIMLFVAAVSFVIPIATLVFVILIYKNTKK